MLTCHSFSTAGAGQLSADLSAICSVVDAYAGTAVAERGLQKCLEGVQLISLPVKGSKPRVSKPPRQGYEDEWAAWDAEIGAEGEESGIASEDAPEIPEKVERTEASSELGLWEVERRLFDTNEAARDVLDDLGLEVLTEMEARNVLRRRIELGS